MSYPGWETVRNSIFTRTRHFPMIDADMPTFMGLPLATSAADLRGADAVIIGAPYVAGWGEYAGVPKRDWIAGPKRVRQQSVRYPSGYVQDFDLDIFEHLKVVDYGDARIPPEAIERPTVENILRAQAAVEDKVNEALDAGAVPIVIGQNSPCGSYAIAKPIAERTTGKVGVMGFCWGGGLTNQVAVRSEDVSAVVPYYGAQPASEDVASIKAPLLLQYAGLDDRINAGIPAYEEALKKAGVDYTIYVYEGANHAFNNDTNEARYNKDAADLAWSRTIDFFKQHLAG